MILAKLLTAGKALTALRDAPTSYRMRPQVRLPKFGSGGNPFAAADKRTGDVAAREIAPVAPATSSQGASARSSVWPWKIWQAAKHPASATTGQAERSGARVEKVSAPPQQGELSLEKVKVVCNDLHESDVELVLRSPEAKPARPTVAAGLWPRAAVAEKALDRLAARILGAEPR